MQEPMIPVSVIVPNYNSGTYLSESIKSINSGQWPAEILIIDDCSTDGSFELAMRLQQQFSNIRVLRREVNGGAAEARRFGIAESTQHLIAFVDADDFIEKNAIKDAYVEIIRSGSDMCIWEMWRFDEKKKWKHDANPKDFPKTGAEAVLLTLGSWRIHPLGISRKLLYEKAYQGFSEMTVNADELLTRIVFSHATQIVGCRSKYFYRSNPVSTSRTLTVRRLTSLRSHLWLLEFTRYYPGAPRSEMVQVAISEAWFYWTQRKQIGIPETLKALRRFLAGIYRFPDFWFLQCRSPKYLAGLMFLSMAAWVPL